MGIVEHLSMLFTKYRDGICYGEGILILILLYAVFGGRGLYKPNKEDIFPFVKKILQYFRERKQR